MNAIPAPTQEQEQRIEIASPTGDWFFTAPKVSSIFFSIFNYKGYEGLQFISSQHSNK